MEKMWLSICLQQEVSLPSLKCSCLQQLALPALHMHVSIIMLAVSQACISSITGAGPTHLDPARQMNCLKQTG